MSNFSKRIDKEYDHLTPGLKKVASYLLKEPTAFAANPAKKVGDAIGVSETMVVRLSIALGYKGYSELQREVRDYVFEQKRVFQNYQIEDGENKRTIYEQVMLHDQINIQKTANNLSEEDFNKAIKALSYSERILVAGLRYTFSMAHWFTYVLRSIGLNSQLFRPDLDVHLEPGSDRHILTIFSFHAYSIETLQLAEEAKKSGWTIIGFTDSRIAPIADYADILFTVQFPERENSETAPIVFSLLNAIVSGISLLEPERTIEGKRKMEDNRIKQTFKL